MTERVRNINDYVNNHDLENFAKIYPFNDIFIFRLSEVNSITELFKNNNYFCFLFLEGDTEIGHWVVLRKDTETEYTYFDCLAGDLPVKLEGLFNAEPTRVGLTSLTRPLMQKDGIICGKYCISFVLAGAIDCVEYYNLWMKMKQPFRDEFIDKMYQLIYERIE